MAIAPNYGTLARACQMVGGDRPIHPSTYYRGVRAGRYPPPEHPSPNIARVDLDKLAAALRAGEESEPTA
jgi:hypothetical protein